MQVHIVGDNAADVLVKNILEFNLVLDVVFWIHEPVWLLWTIWTNEICPELGAH